jgi:hypothetical protein
MTLDSIQCEAALSVLYGPGEVIELRALGAKAGTPKWKRVAAGYYNDKQKLIKDASDLNGRYSGLYTVLNVVAPELLARSVNHLTDNPDQTTSDTNILRRKWLFVDFDPKRPSGIASTDEEQQAAFDCAKKCREWLSEQGWPEPIRADSGNGAHLLYRVDLPNDDDAKQLVEGCLKGLAFRFTDDRVDVDQSTFNAARLGKLYGSKACKGDPLPDRPHRISRMVKVPDSLVVVREKLLKKLARTVPEEASKPQNPPTGNFNGKPFDLEQWIADSGLEVAKTGPWNGGRKWVLGTCPWNAEHTDRSAYIIEQQSGAIGAGCQHSSCGDKKWHALRDVVEPGWREARRTNGKTATPSNTPKVSRDVTFAQTDDGNANRLVRRHGSDLRYCFETGWLYWDDTRWTLDKTGEVRRRAVETVKAIGDEAKEQ